MMRTGLALFLLATPLFALPPVRDGRAAAQKQLATFTHPAGLTVELWAADPLIASPVAICLDERNRVFVAEEFRFNRGTEENRTRPFLLDDDLQIETVEQRLAMYQKWAAKFDGGMDWFRQRSDRVRLLEDRAGRGWADRSTIFASGFNDPLDGLAAGLIARDGNVYFTCIPHLWLLRDTDGDGRADVRRSLHRGFGANCAFLGHDLHGLVWGPDGRLYFSIGDRGFHVTTKEGHTLHGPRTGAVFRCEPDGSGLEVVHRGLRNPQELAFDQFGNLFTADNNCDKGDHARLVYIVEGGDSGWNMAYQTIPEPYLTGPWHAERMWHLPHAGQPAWIIPPVAPLGAGPSGFVFTSGLSLPPRYRDRFFYCNYTGRGGVEAFGVESRGAGFVMIDHHDFLKPVMATDVDFGYDGKMYVADFVNLLWDGASAGGRIYTLFDSKRLHDPVVQETKRLFAEGVASRRDTELVKLLGHADQRVRLRAQFALADRGDSSRVLLQQTMTHSPDPLARRHALWGLGQLARRTPAHTAMLVPMLRDGDTEIRAQAAKTIGECRGAGANAELIALLRDASPRVRFFAAQALGQLRHAPAVEPLFAMLKEAGDQDLFLRHAGVTALASIGAGDAAASRVRDESSAVRLAALLVLRRLNDRRIVEFLNDAELPIVTEAARAIHDLPIEPELPALAALLERHGANASPEIRPLLRRAIHAHYRLGTPASAAAVARFAADARADGVMRAEAIATLADWVAPPPRDRVTGVWRALPARDPAPIRAALEPIAPELLARAEGQLLADVVGLVGRLDIKTDESTVLRWVRDGTRPTAMRTAALRLLATRKAVALGDAIAAALASPDAKLRAEARGHLIAREPERGRAALTTVLEDDRATVVERQHALALLAKQLDAAAILDRWADRLTRGEVPAELQLDVLDALRANAVGKRKTAVDAWDATHPPSDLMAKFRVSLAGGDVERGRALFVGHAGAQCIRCHRVHGTGGDAGPELTRVVERNPMATREHLLQSLLVPSAKIAEGFATIALTLDDGKVIAGVLKKEDAESITLTLPEGSLRVVAKSRIEERSTPQSAMPEMGRVLTPREVRDLIEYLMTLK